MIELPDGVVRPGHFVYESGHHGDTWLDLDLLLVDSSWLARATRALARLIAPWRPDVVCGPDDGGAIVALAAAKTLGVEAIHATRRAGPPPDYTVAGDFAGRRVVIVDDAVNAGSAVLTTARRLADAGGTLTGVASLIGCLPSAAGVGEALGVSQIWLLGITTNLWLPEHCPHCARARP